MANAMVFSNFSTTVRTHFYGVRQPRTQAQMTKNRHTAVFLYRSVAKLSERAGVLGEDATETRSNKRRVTTNCRFLKFSLEM